jgi:tRNA pseudouridine55 synthase
VTGLNRSGRRPASGGPDATAPSGLVVVDKPAGMTSHDVVDRCRRIFSTRRVGHAGTLDPSATGVLLVAVGPATRLLRFLAGLPKTYRGEAVLGLSTSTLDADGEAVGRWDMSEIGLDEVRRAAATLRGELLQEPPAISAVKVKGQPLYRLARAGVAVERSPRPVTVHTFEVDPGDEAGVFAIHVACSSGTYVRSLVADLGTRLGGGAHLRGLRRLAVGPYPIDEARPLEVLAVTDLLEPLELLRGWDRVAVGPDLARAVSHGAVLQATGLFADDALSNRAGPFAVVDEAGRLLATYERAGGRIKPTVVLAGGE